MTNYVIIGNGVAGTTAAENIRKLDKEGNITIITEENLPFYYRIRLNEYISGDIDEQALIAKNEQWYKDLGIDLILKTRIVDACAAVTQDQMKKAVYHLLGRCRLVVEQNGGHVEHIL